MCNSRNKTKKDANDLSAISFNYETKDRVIHMYDSTRNHSHEYVYIPEDYQGSSKKFDYDNLVIAKIVNESIPTDVENWYDLYNHLTCRETIHYDIEKDEQGNTKLYVYKGEELILNLVGNSEWEMIDPITIRPSQKVRLISDQDITLKRAESHVSSFFTIKGTLSIGSEDLKGSITLDGNSNMFNDQIKTKVNALSSLINVSGGNLNIYDKVTLKNNCKIERGTEDVKSDIIEISAKGGAILANGGTITMYGGTITDNTTSIYLTKSTSLDPKDRNPYFDIKEKKLYLPEKMNYYYQLNSMGAGIALTNGTVFTMYDGSISGNRGYNSSEVIKSTPQGSVQYVGKKGHLSQLVKGVGISAESNSVINIYGGKIEDNYAYNKSKLQVTNAKINSSNSGNYGIGIYLDSSNLYIHKDAEHENKEVTIKNNYGLVAPTINIDSDSIVLDKSLAANRGSQIYAVKSTLNLNDAIITTDKETNISKVDTSKISIQAKNAKGNDCTKSTISFAGGVSIQNNSEFNFNNITISNFEADYAAGMYITNSTGTITNSNITNNKSAGNAGGIYTSNSTLTITDSNITDNTAQDYGAGIYINSGTVTTENSEITNNTLINNKNKQYKDIYKK